jgi:hypothetical protein
MIRALKRLGLGILIVDGIALAFGAIALAVAAAVQHL